MKRCRMILFAFVTISFFIILPSSTLAMDALEGKLFSALAQSGSPDAGDV